MNITLQTMCIFNQTFIAIIKDKHRKKEMCVSDSEKFMGISIVTTNGH
jgi:hypothetical protein